MVMGVKAPQAKTATFALSAFFPAFVGTLYFFKNGNVEPEDAFRFQMSLEILVMVMLGGKGLVLGPILGAFAYERLRGYLLISPVCSKTSIWPCPAAFSWSSCSLCPAAPSAGCGNAFPVSGGCWNELRNGPAG